jgi:hypothetical protein
VLIFADRDDKAMGKVFTTGSFEGQLIYESKAYDQRQPKINRIQG